MVYNWKIDSSTDSMSCRGQSYSLLTVEFDEDTQRYIGIVWGEVAGSYYDQPCAVEVDSCCYDTKVGAVAWCEGMDIINMGQEIINEIPLMEMAEKMKDEDYV